MPHNGITRVPWKNLAVQAEKLLREVVYKGDKGSFGTNKYHQIITQAFNMLDETHDPTAGRDTCLSKIKKITKFMAPIKENDCAKTCIEAEWEIRKCPANQQTFNNIHSDMLGSLYKYRTMVQSDGSSSVSFNIYSLDSALHDPTAAKSGRGGGRGRGRGCGRGSGGRGRG